MDITCGRQMHRPGNKRPNHINKCSAAARSKLGFKEYHGLLLPTVRIMTHLRHKIERPRLPVPVVPYVTQ